MQADGSEAIEALAEIPLLVGGLDIPCGDIVQDGVAEDIVFRLPCGNVLRVLSQNDGQFTFVVQLFHEVGMGLDEAAVRHGPGDPLGKVDGVLMFGRKASAEYFSASSEWAM